MNKIGPNFMDDDDSNIIYVVDMLPNSPVGCQLPSQAKKNVWIMNFGGEEPIKEKVALEYIKRHQSNKVNSKFNIIICKIKYFQCTDLKELRSGFDQIIPVV